ncbi:AraC family transcriptional regulator [Azospirillum thiophilum]|uniref:AraC family transcriptional regulator n=1 Tax=Azospirillum thiophilum TaxID=528244 RepID=A0AAC8W303_9PROT|nr:AraC family transcriptional regulator [Azospirillum thiophilum]ALG74011.1 AraC family transcriptional regulator [Azospirillum thiophilum]KJR63645.1 AraC family transcriptional regulator [Azospirillum thiophilum]
MTPHRPKIGQTADRRTGTVQHNILAAAACGVSGFIAAQGGCADRVFLRAGVEERALGQPTLALDLGAYVAMMEEAAAETGNDNFGLLFGRQFQPEMLGLIGSIALAAPTLGAALEHLARLFPFHQQATETRFVREGELLRLEYRILDGGIVERRQDAELTMGMFANVVRACLGPGWMPEEVHFEHPRPEGWRQHEALFDAPAHFGQRTNALLLRDRHLDRRMPGGDMARLTGLCGTLVDIARGTGTPPLLDRVRAEVRACLPDGPPHVEDIADRLGIARWTLQRRLADEGLSFSDLVERVRRDLAAIHIRQRHVPIADIGALLGYSEVSAFSRAFRRWFGVSPARMRA